MARPNGKDRRSMDDERQYLENLLNQRFNFYLVFVSFFLFGIFGGSLGNMERGIALVIGAFISLFIALAVLRTRMLVEEALNDLRELHRHPYGTLYKRLKDKEKYKTKWYWPFNWYGPLRTSANNYIATVPWLVTMLLLALAIFSLVSGSDTPAEANTTLTK